MSEIFEGTVKWFSNERGYGFIFQEGLEEEEYFVHYSFINKEGYKTLTEGQKVNFSLKMTDKGAQAFDVTPLPIDA